MASDALDDARTALNNWNGGAGLYDAAWTERRAHEFSVGLERLTAPPTDDEREALESVISDALFEWDGDTRPAQRIAAYVREAGFRRQGPITDAQDWEYAQAYPGRTEPIPFNESMGYYGPTVPIRRRKAGPWEQVE